MRTLLTAAALALLAGCGDQPRSVAELCHESGNGLLQLRVARPVSAVDERPDGPTFVTSQGDGVTFLLAKYGNRVEEAVAEALQLALAKQWFQRVAYPLRDVACLDTRHSIKPAQPTAKVNRQPKRLCTRRNEKLEYVVSQTPILGVRYVQAGRLVVLHCHFTINPRMLGGQSALRPGYRDSPASILRPRH